MYTLDTNILVFLQRAHPRDVFPTIWNWLDDQLDCGELCVSTEVITELLRRGKNEDRVVVDEIKEHCPCASMNPTDEEARVTAEIGMRYPDWVRGFQNGADPWIIAHAKSHAAGIMTNEKYEENPSLMNPRIPFVAQQLYGLKSVDFLSYARENHLWF